MRTYLLNSLALCCCLSALAGKDFDVPPAVARKPVMDEAEALALRPVLAPVPANLRNPFDLVASELTLTPTASASISDADVLALLAGKVVPSGVARFKGEHVLLIKGRKFRASDHLVITYEGREYDIEITEVKQTSYTLRLNRTELIRPIKSK
jgi:hypothetical protein